MIYLVSEGMDRAALKSEYKHFIAQKRKEFRNQYAPYGLPEPFAGDSPIVRWRESIGLSRSGLAKSLCVQPSLLERVETGKTYELPEQLVEALKQADFPIHLIEELQERLDECYT